MLQDGRGVAVDLAEPSTDVGDVGRLGVQPAGKVGHHGPAVCRQQQVGPLQERLRSLRGHHRLGARGTGDHPGGGIEPLGGVDDGVDSRRVVACDVDSEFLRSPRVRLRERHSVARHRDVRCGTDRRLHRFVCRLLHTVVEEPRTGD